MADGEENGRRPDCKHQRRGADCPDFTPLAPLALLPASLGAGSVTRAGSRSLGAVKAAEHGCRGV